MQGVSRYLAFAEPILIAMFALVLLYKEFRRWVLDILDREVQQSPITKQFTDNELLHTRPVMASKWYDVNRLPERYASSSGRRASRSR